MKVLSMGQPFILLAGEVTASSPSQLRALSVIVVKKGMREHNG